MRYAFITGTSRGIGRTLADLLLEQGWMVTGFSRSAGPAHPHYTHISIDLCNEEAATAYRFPELNDAEQIVLVNNAGMLGHIAHTGAVEAAELAATFRLNLTVPALFCNEFLNAYRKLQCPQVLLNVSSGAGKYPVDGWAAYCASKAGLDLFTRTVHEELRIDGHNHIRIFSVAPGIVDTAMQAQIRSSSTADFSRADEFRNWHHSGELLSAENAAFRYLYILNRPGEFAEPVFAAKEITAQQLESFNTLIQH
jgi:benzil reductase ((S)-benzoin forming)